MIFVFYLSPSGSQHVCTRCETGLEKCVFKIHSSSTALLFLCTCVRAYLLVWEEPASFHVRIVGCKKSESDLLQESMVPS